MQVLPCGQLFGCNISGQSSQSKLLYLWSLHLRNGTWSTIVEHNLVPFTWGDSRRLCITRGGEACYQERKRFVCMWTCRNDFFKLSVMGLRYHTQKLTQTGIIWWDHLIHKIFFFDGLFAVTVQPPCQYSWLQTCVRYRFLYESMNRI